MRVLLVHPPLSTTAEVTPPLGLCTLAAYLRQQGHDLRILDLDLEIKGQSDGRQKYLGILDRALREYSPQAVGITSMYNNSLQAARLVILIKRFDSSIVTIAGGSHVGALGRQALTHLPELDYAIEGEGEQAFAALLAAIETGEPIHGIPRLQYRIGPDVRKNPSNGLLDLSALPPVWPNLDGILDIQRYTKAVPEGSQRRAIYLEAGRGCPFACTFCATAPFWERKYRV